MGTYSSIPGWRIPWTEEPGGLYIPWGPKESDMTEATVYKRQGRGAQTVMDLWKVRT